jgi:hypothetical protein
MNTENIDFPFQQTPVKTHTPLSWKDAPKLLLASAYLPGYVYTREWLCILGQGLEIR